MSLTIKRGKDKRVVHALLINLADLPDGITVATADLVKGTPIMEGALIGLDNSGVAHLVKTAKVVETAASNATSYKIAKNSHLKVGDVIALTIGGAAVAITAIDRENATYDAVTVGSTLGAASVGAVIKQASAAAAENCVLKYNPIAMLAESYDVDATNIFAAAVTIGQFKSALVPPIDASLKSALTANGSFINFV